VFPYQLALGQNPVVGPDLPRSVLVLNALPRSEAEYRNVFGTDTVSQSAVSQMRHAQQSLEASFDRAQIQSMSTIMSPALLRLVPGTVVVVIGHNEKGVIRMPDGRRVSIREASLNCLKAAKLCIFLSCRSAAYLDGLLPGVHRDIGLAEASAFAKEIKELVERETAYQRQFSSAHTPVYIVRDPHGMMERLTGVLTRGRRTLYVGLMKAGVFIIVAIIVAEASDEDD
jgi:hypothetical protein